MKKVIAAVLTVLFAAIVLASCGKSDSVKNVQALIDGIGSKVSLDSEEAINSAKAAFDALSDEEKEKVGNRKKLETAIEKYENLTDMNDYIAAVISAAETEFSKDDFKVSELVDRYDAMVEAYGEMKKADKEQITDFDKLEEAIAKLKEYNSSAVEPAAAYVRGFLEVNKDKGYTITKVGCIKQIREDKEYHFFSLSYKDKNGNEHNVYSTARFSGANVLSTIIARPDIFFADEPASADTDCLENGNVDIDLDAVLEAANKLSVDIVATTKGDNTAEEQTSAAAE